VAAVQTQVVVEQVVIAVLLLANLQVVVLPQNPCSLSQWARLILSQWVVVALAELTIMPLPVLLDQILCLVQLRHWAEATEVQVLEITARLTVQVVVRAVEAQQRQRQIPNALVVQELQDRATQVAPV
jgi:hypothetical protein